MLPILGPVVTVRPATARNFVAPVAGQVTAVLRNVADYQPGTIRLWDIGNVGKRSRVRGWAACREARRKSSRLWPHLAISTRTIAHPRCGSLIGLYLRIV